MQEALNVCTEVHNIIKLSPKRLAVFETMQLAQPTTEGPHASIKPLCPTLWTLRTKPITAVLENYEALQDTLDVVNSEHKRDEIAIKAPGVKTQMEKVQVLFRCTMPR